MIPKGQEWGLAAKIARGVFLAWLFWLLGAVIFTACEKEGRAGLVGDFFGGFSALFASLGFVGVVFTLYQQHQDSEDAEERRREDKKEEAAAKSEAERLRVANTAREDERRKEEQDRHAETVAAQGCIARIQAFTALIGIYNAELVEMEHRQSLYRDWLDEKRPLEVRNRASHAIGRISIDTYKEIKEITENAHAKTALLAATPLLKWSKRKMPHARR